MINLLVGLCFSVAGDPDFYKIERLDPKLNYAIVTRIINKIPTESIVVYPKNVIMSTSFLVNCTTGSPYETGRD